MHTLYLQPLLAHRASRRENLMQRRPQDVESCKDLSAMRFERAQVRLKPVLDN